MKYNRYLTLAIAFKVCLLMISLSLVTVWHILGESIAWFNQVASPGVIEDNLKSNKYFVDVVNDYVNPLGEREEGLTGLMFAAKYGYPDRAQLLLKYKASVNMRAKDSDGVGNTALHYAVLNSDDDNSFAVAKILINDPHIDVTETNNKGDNVLHRILEIDNLDRRLELFKLILNKIPEDFQRSFLNAQNNNGNTMMHMVAELNRIDWLRMMVKEYGKMFRYDIRNKKGQLPENIAREVGRGGDMERDMKMLRNSYNLKSDFSFKLLADKINQ